MRSRDSFIIGRVGFYEMVDRRAGRGLAAFVEPESRNHPRIIGTPNTGDEARLGRCRHDAGRGPHDVGKTTAYIDCIARLPAPPIVPTPPACASISDAPTGVPSRKPKSCAADLLRPAPSGVPGATISFPIFA